MEKQKTEAGGAEQVYFGGERSIEAGAFQKAIQGRVFVEVNENSRPVLWDVGALVKLGQVGAPLFPNLLKDAFLMSHLVLIGLL